MVCLGLDVVVVDVDLLDPTVVVLMPAYQEGGVVSFVPLSFFASPRDTCCC